MTRFPTAVCLLGLLALVGCNQQPSPTAPTPPPAGGSTVNYTAVGASDASGVGSSVPCFPFTECPNGMGYVPVIARTLQGQGMTVNLSNLGIPAAVIGPDFQALATQYNRSVPGNFIDQEAPFVPRNSTVVTIFAGGNDILTIQDAVGGGAGSNDILGFADQQIKAFGDDFQTLLGTIRDRAPSARIIVANIPNFAGIPMTARYPLERKRFLQKLSVGFDTQVINPLVSQGVIVVDLLCDSRFTSSSIFSSDGFHPNDRGYGIMASLMVDAITSGSYPAPSQSCRQMTLVPAL